MNRRIILTVKTWRGEKDLIAYTPELDIASQGKTEEKAVSNLREVVSLFIESVKKTREI